MNLERTQHDLEATAIQVAGIAIELNSVAKDLTRYGVLCAVEEIPNDYGFLTTVGETSSHCGQIPTAEKWREHLRLRAIGLQAEAGRLALAALSAARAGEQIACAARGESFGKQTDGESAP